MTAILIVLAISLSITTTLLLLKIRGERHIASKLKELNSKDTQELLKLSPSNPISKELLIEINNLINTNRENNIKYINLEKELKIVLNSISDDLKTPLTSILGYLEMLSEEELSVQEKLDYIVIIENRAKILKELISNYHNLSKFRSNEYDLELSSVNISLLLTNVLASFYNTFIIKELHPTINIIDSDIEVSGNSIAINRIFSTIINNIINNGEGDITIELIELEEGIITRFKNKDTKLTSNDLLHIFDKFFISDKSRSLDKSNSGLSITKNLVQRQGHKISAYKENDYIIIQIFWLKNTDSISNF